MSSKGSEDGARELIRIPQIVIERPEFHLSAVLGSGLLGALIGALASWFLKVSVEGEIFSVALWFQPPFPSLLAWVVGGALLGALLGLARGPSTTAELMLVDVEATRPRLRFSSAPSTALARRTHDDDVDDVADTLPPRLN